MGGETLNGSGAGWVGTRTQVAWLPAQLTTLLPTHKQSWPKTSSPLSSCTNNNDWWAVRVRNKATATPPLPDPSVSRQAYSVWSLARRWPATWLSFWIRTPFCGPCQKKKSAQGGESLWAPDLVPESRWEWWAEQTSLRWAPVDPGFLGENSLQFCTVLPSRLRLSCQGLVGSTEFN